MYVCMLSAKGTFYVQVIINLCNKFDVMKLIVNFYISFQKNEIYIYAKASINSHSPI